MPIKLRTLKGTALTYEELDRNFSQVFYSASVANGNLQLWYTGSANLSTVEGGLTVSYTPRLGATIPLNVAAGGGGSTGTSAAGGVSGNVQYKDNSGLLAGDDGLFYDAVNRRLGIGTISPTRHLQIQSNTTTPAVLRFAGVASATSVAGGKTFMEFYRGDTEVVGEIGLLENTGTALTINAKTSKGLALSVDGSRKIIVSGSGVGIGSNFAGTPNQTLTLVGTMGIGDSMTDANQSVIKQLAGITSDSLPLGATTQGLLIETPKGDFGGNLVIGLNTTSTLGNEGFSIVRGAKGVYPLNTPPVATFKAKGYVGLGTNNPTAILHVQTGSLGGTLGNVIHNNIFQNTAIENTEYLEIKSVRTAAGNNWNTSGKRIQMKVDFTHMGYMQFNGTGNNGGISFGAGTSNVGELSILERMRIQENGYVGIGTTTPSAKFQVVGNGASDPGGTAVFTGTNLSSHFYYLASEDTFIRGGKTTSKLYLGDANRVDSNDSATTIYIGTSFSVPGYRVHIQGSTHLSGATLLAGATTLNNTLTVAGATTLSNTLGVTGATTLSNTLGVTGATNLNSTLGVTGATTLNNTLTVAGAANLNSSLTVLGNATVNGTLTVVGGSQTQTNVTSTGTLRGINVTGEFRAGGYAPQYWYANGGIVTETVINSTVGPVIGFHNPNVYGSSIQLTGPGEFKFWQQNGTSLANITANNYTGLWKGADYNTGAIANNIVQRNANGHIFGTFLNVTNPGDAGQAILGRFAGFNSTDPNGSDNFLRYYSAQVAANALSGKTMNIAGTATSLASNRDSYVGAGVMSNVVGQLGWKNYGAGHTIFAASNSTSPNGTVVGNKDSQIIWASTHPTLMGWNGVSTYGVRVDSARLADNATLADTATLATQATKLTNSRLTYASTGVIDNVVGQLAWKSWAINNHTIFDASAKTSPQGTTIDHLNAQIPWSVTTTTGQGYPNLMGWNGTNTHGVRVDSARLADTATLATQATKLVSNRTNYNGTGVIDNVVGQLAWKANGNNHTIFDASAGVSPQDNVIGKKNPTYNWVETYPTLMGWANGATHGVRVDSARQADICPDYLPLQGGTMGGSITFLDYGSATPARRGIYGYVGNSNDQWFVGGGSAGDDKGFLELATGDNGGTYGGYDPIYVSQYSGYLTAQNSPTLSRRAKLLDEYGNTTFPGTLVVGTDGHEEASVGRAGFTRGGLTYPSAYLFSNTSGWGLWSDNSQETWGNRQGGGALISYNRARKRAFVDPPLNVNSLFTNGDISFYDSNASTTALPENSYLTAARRYRFSKVIDTTNFTVLCRVDADYPGGTIKLTAVGVNGATVINANVDIMVTHYKNIDIKSFACTYSTLVLDIRSDDNGQFSIGAKIQSRHSTSDPTMPVEFEIFPQNSERVKIDGATVIPFSANTPASQLIHVCDWGTKQSAFSPNNPSGPINSDAWNSSFQTTTGYRGNHSVCGMMYNGFRSDLFPAYQITATSTSIRQVVNGTVLSNAAQYMSDRRLKEKIKPIKGGLSKVLALEGVNFNWKKHEFRDFPTERQAGFIAQQVEEVLPDLVSDDGEMKSINYNGIVPYLVEAIKELKAEIELLKKK